jgi:hypothetical protein
MSEFLNENLTVNSITYETVDQAELDRVREKHAWIVEPIIRASDNLGRMPFFEWLGQIKCPRDFKPAAL